jgi:hypothetical protein
VITPLQLAAAIERGRLARALARLGRRPAYAAAILRRTARALPDAASPGQIRLVLRILDRRTP